MNVHFIHCNLSCTHRSATERSQTAKKEMNSDRKRHFLKNKRDKIHIFSNSSFLSSSVCFIAFHRSVSFQAIYHLLQIVLHFCRRTKPLKYQNEHIKIVQLVDTNKKCFRHSKHSLQLAIVIKQTLSKYLPFHRN